MELRVGPNESRLFPISADDPRQRKCYWARASCDCGRLQIGDV